MFNTPLKIDYVMDTDDFRNYWRLLGKELFNKAVVGHQLTLDSELMQLELKLCVPRRIIPHQFYDNSNGKRLNAEYLHTVE